MINTSGGVEYIRNWRFTRPIVGMVFILGGNYKSATPKNNRVWRLVMTIDKETSDGLEMKFPNPS